jgi:hypothetical protein
MCTSTLHIRPKSLLGMSYDVPCGNCLECRSLSQNSWVTRLGFDLKDLYERGGVAVFLTFTYNDYCLPKSEFLSDELIPCFRREDVLRFLNQLKVLVNRRYGKSMYKYFLCSEYGKFTKRPHYHGLFMLQPGVDSTWFSETCRKIWHYGYMFPRYKDGRYVDNLGACTSVELRNLNAACKYVSKYITKDIDYYDLPAIKYYMNVRDSLSDDMRKYYNGFLPRHYQSKGIGSSLLKNGCDASTLLDYVKNGIYNPTTCKVDALPRYYVEKLCFDHNRIVVDGHVKVIRTLKPSYADVMREIHRQSFTAKIGQLNNFLHNVNLNVFTSHGYTISDYIRFNRLRELHTSEYYVLHRWYDRLTPECKYYFDVLGYKELTLNNIVNFRVDLYTLCVDTFISKFVDKNADVAWYMDIFDKITKYDRSVKNEIRYNDYLRVQKLKLINKQLL